MKKLPLLLLTVLSFWAAGLSPLLAKTETVVVTFHNGVKPEFVKVLSAAFASPVKQLQGQTWQFTVPALKTQDEYAELFASLPSVASTQPVPVYKVADHINPQAVNIQPFDQGQPVKSQDYLPGEMLVKFKNNASMDDIQFLNSHNQVIQISRIPGIDVYRLRLPQGMSVEEAVELYNQSGIVEYAEPNYRMAIPSPVPTTSPAPVPSGSPAPSANPTSNNNIPNGTAVFTQIPLDGGGQMLIHFRPGTPPEAVAKFHQIFGTREAQKESFYSYRIQLPAGLNPAVAVRIFKLYPRISDVQRLYS